MNRQNPPRPRSEAELRARPTTLAVLREACLRAGDTHQADLYEARRIAAMAAQGGAHGPRADG
jgi:hypothetical protein